MSGVRQDAAGLERLMRDRVEASIRTKQALLEDLRPALEVAEMLVSAYRRGGCLFLFGNGGSAADSQHIAAEFLGRFYIERRALPAQALTVNTSALTAIGNDYSFETVFARQLEALGRPGDVAMGISTSGNARNVVAGLEAGRRLGLKTVALTGAGGGRSREFADHWVGVPADDTPRIQECHILLGHIWSEIVEAALAGESERAAPSAG